MFIAWVLPESVNVGVRVLEQLIAHEHEELRGPRPLSRRRDVEPVGKCVWVKLGLSLHLRQLAGVCV